MNLAIYLGYVTVIPISRERTEVAALLHDIGHVPFGHTLEDEFPGVYERHDILGGARLYSLVMKEDSEINRILRSCNIWEHDALGRTHLSNQEVIDLIYVILSWKEQLWKMYIFVDRTIYDDRARSRKIVDCVQQEYELPKAVLYTKVRTFPLILSLKCQNIPPSRMTQVF